MEEQLFDLIVCERLGPHRANMRNTSSTAAAAALTTGFLKVPRRIQTDLS